MGALASAYLHACREGYQALSAAERAALLRPRPQLETMQKLVGNRLVSAASDSSDGVIGALYNISAASGNGLELYTDIIDIPAHVFEEARANNLSPWNLFFFWGDWQVIATIPEASLADAKRIVPPGSLTVLGRVTNGTGVQARVGTDLRLVAPVRNENFKQTGFASEMESHVRFMLTTDVF